MLSVLIKEFGEGVAIGVRLKTGICVIRNVVRGVAGGEKLGFLG